MSDPMSDFMTLKANAQRIAHKYFAPADCYVSVEHDTLRSTDLAKLRHKSGDEISCSIHDFEDACSRLSESLYAAEDVPLSLMQRLDNLETKVRQIELAVFGIR